MKWHHADRAGLKRVDADVGAECAGPYWDPPCRKAHEGQEDAERNPERTRQSLSGKREGHGQPADRARAAAVTN